MASDGLHKRKARKKPFLTPAHVLKRLEWAWNNCQTDWRSVVFTDEATVESGQREVTAWTIRRVGEEFEEKHLVPAFRRDRKTLMVWDSVAYGKKWPLKRLTHHPTFDLGKGNEGVNRYYYINSVLEERLAGYLSELRMEGRPGVKTVEDGARIHDNHMAHQAREELHFTASPHPPISPDLNAIEPLWGILKARVANFIPVISTFNKLWELLKKLWDELEQHIVNREVEKMEERKRAVIKAKGKNTGYRLH